MFITRTNCPGCRSSEFSLLQQLDFSAPVLASFLDKFYQSRIQSRRLNGHSYTLCECERCKLLFQQHILDDDGMDLLYDRWIDANKSLQKRQQGKDKQFRKYASECETIARMIKKKPHQIRVVEFGMGWGYWCRMAIAFNFRVTGMELSPTRITHAESMGVPVATSFEQIDNKSVDFIYANQVFEHLSNPLETIRQLANLLAADGILLIRVPDGRGIADTLRQSGWEPEMKAIHPLEHINAFTRESLIHMASIAGLTTCRAPMRLSCHSPAHLWRGLKREYNDRYVLPHVYFSRKN